MTQSPTSQGSLFVQEHVGQDARIDVKSSPQLSLVLDYRDLLNLLADEWLAPVITGRVFGVGERVVNSGTDEEKIVVGWLRDGALPDVDVCIEGSVGWRKGTVSSIGIDDHELVWSTALPLSAFERFTVPSLRAQERIRFLAEKYSTLTKYSQPIEVAEQKIYPAVACEKATVLPVPPPNWDALRGAAAMAVWSVPTVGPWMQALCETLNLHDRAQTATKLGVPWWNEPPWRALDVQAELPAPEIALWRAAVSVFTDANLQHGWQSLLILDKLVEQAVVFQADPAYLERFAARTRSILSDRSGVSLKIAESDPLGLALQLVLLRPEPERFFGWLEQLPGMPPGVWWTGATLSGLISGYRDLERKFTGTEAARSFLALRTWQLAMDEIAPFALVDSKQFQNTLMSGISDGFAKLFVGDQVIAERAESPRGKWFTADLGNDMNRAEAVALAGEFYPAALTTQLMLKDVAIIYKSVKGATLKKSASLLTVDGTVVLNLPHDYVISRELDDDLFRDWILRGSIVARLNPPPFFPDVKSGMPRLKTAGPVEKEHIAGLSKKLDFLTEQEEEELVQIVDSAPWQESLSRRVQHYGWRYDYKSGRIDLRNHLGPLPAWADDLAKRLMAQGLVKEMPDQVIVNEYVRSQGISAHIDCPSCFRGPVVTISLMETWEMVFRKGTDCKHVEMLQRRSACIIDGEARAQWKHEISKKIKGPDGIRLRRISLTFRKVNVL